MDKNVRARVCVWHRAWTRCDFLEDDFACGPRAVGLTETRRMFEIKSRMFNSRTSNGPIGPAQLFAVHR